MKSRRCAGFVVGGAEFVVGGEVGFACERGGFGVAAGGVDGVDEGLGDLAGGLGFIIVHGGDEERGCGFGVLGVGHGGCGVARAQSFAKSGLDERGVHALAFDAVGEVVHAAAPGNDAANVRGFHVDVGERPRIEGNEGGQVTARGMAHQDHFVGIAAVFGDVYGPSDGGGDIIDLGGMRPAGESR